MSYRSTFANTAFVRMLAGHGVATLGQLQLTMAVGIHALNVTGAGIWVAAAVSLGFVPYVLFSTYAGTLADRHSRSTVLRWSIRLRVITAALTTSGLVLGWPVAVVIALAALTATLATPSYPALAAATPQLVDDDDLPAANSLSAGIENAAWTAGPGLLGLLLLLGAPVAGGGLASLACFVAAYVCLGRVHVPAPATAAEGRETGPAILGAFRIAGANRVIRRVLLLAVMDNALYGYMVVALVLMGERALGAGEAGIGVLNAAFAVGAIASIAVAARLPGRGPYAWLIALTSAFALSAVGLALAPTLGLAAAAVFLAGLFTVSAEIVAVTLLQRNTPEILAARVFGLYDTLAILAVALFTALAGWLSDAIGTRVALVAVSVLAGCAVCGMVLQGRRRRVGAAAAWGPRRHPVAAAAKHQCPGAILHAPSATLFARGPRSAPESPRIRHHSRPTWGLRSRPAGATGSGPARWTFTVSREGL